MNGSALPQTSGRLRSRGGVGAKLGEPLLDEGLPDTGGIFAGLLRGAGSNEDCGVVIATGCDVQRRQVSRDVRSSWITGEGFGQARHGCVILATSGTGETEDMERIDVGRLRLKEAEYALFRFLPCSGVQEGLSLGEG